MTGLSIKDIKANLDSMMWNLHQEFGDRLIAVVVYGSYARGSAKPKSDVDLLVVVRGLPRDWDTIHRLEDKWTFKGRQFGKRFQVMFVSPEDVEDSVEYAAPLMLEIYNAHKVIFDQNGFFRNCIIRMEHLIKERGIRMKRQGVWEVPESVIPS